jgi:hypothetical protein
MKIKINRKKRGTHRTRHARQCKRNKNRRTRSQRGGVTKAEVFDKLIGEFSSCTNADFRLTINFHFGSCEIFNKLLKLRNEMSPDLKTVVCNKFTDEQIRINEHLLAIQPRAKALKIQKIETKWPDFVVHLKTVVEARYQKQNDADMAQRMLDLKFPTSDAAAKAAKAAKAAEAARPSSVAPRPSSVAARPSSVAPRPVSAARPVGSEVGTRQVAPPGWELNGNVWQDGKGGYYPADFFETRPPLTGEALLAALRSLNDD